MSSEEVPGGSGTADERTDFDLTDPKAMRALAHPMRMALLELLEVTRTLTATQASELLGETPANCAFHLRTLGKYGYIAEAGGGKGRERPWRMVSRRISLSTNQENPSAALAAQTLQQIWLDRVMQRARQILGSEERPEAWRDAHEASQTVQFLTPEENRQLGDEVRELMDGYQERQDNPDKRPEGAVPVEILYFAYPLTHLTHLAASAEHE